MATTVTFSIILDDRTLYAVKDLDINMPKEAIAGILQAIEREESVRQVVRSLSPIQENKDLKEALHKLREKHEKLQEKLEKKEKNIFKTDLFKKMKV